MILLITQFLATFAAALFTGAAIYINIAEHPARMECGTELAAKVFAPSYKRAAVIQVLLALISTLTGLLAWLIGGQLLALIGAILIVSVIPFTLIAIMPTNKKLLAPDLDIGSSETKNLLVRWGKLHGVRSILGFLATSVFIYSNIAS